MGPCSSQHSKDSCEVHEALVVQGEAISTSAFCDSAGVVVFTLGDAKGSTRLLLPEVECADAYSEIVSEVTCQAKLFSTLSESFSLSWAPWPTRWLPVTRRNGSSFSASS